MDCHTSTTVGFLFHGWPDGEALHEQEMVVVSIFRVINEQFVAQFKIESAK